MTEALHSARSEAIDRITATGAGAALGANRIAAYVDGLVASSRVIARSRIGAERLVRVCGPVAGQPSTVMMAGLDNPDTDYWQAPISADATYEIVGRRGTSADLSFQLLTGDYDDPTALPTSAGTLTLRDLQCGHDGTYRVEIGPDAGGPNALVPDKLAPMLFCRETFSDWCTERPGTMALRRLHGDPPAPTREKADDLAATLLLRRVDVWLQFAPGAKAEITHAGFLHLIEPDTLVGPLQTGGGLPDQFSASGRFALVRDEALVITASPAAAPYMGIQVGDDLFASLPYADRCSSRTAHQSVADPDGDIRWIVSHRDPGVANWIDTTGAAQGFVFIRWQGLRADQPPPAPTIDRIRLGALPRDIARRSPAERKHELRARSTDLERSGRVRAGATD
ncbi:MAG: hypothetical protein AAF480_11565 [Actinomycetota bacterium]